MSDTAARPWWADVQHLRPEAGDAAFVPADPSAAAGARFRRDRERHDGVAEAEVHTPRFPHDRERHEGAAEEPRAPRFPRDREHSTREHVARTDHPAPAPHVASGRSTGRHAVEPRRRPQQARRGHAARPLRTVADGSLRPLDAGGPRPEPTPADRPRRTIDIRGRIEPVSATPPSDEVEQLATRSRSIRARGGRRSPEQLAGPRPDRIALWAVVLGLVLALAAMLSNSEAHAAAAALTPLLGALGDR
jgi:hypothetical protein